MRRRIVAAVFCLSLAWAACTEQATPDSEGARQSEHEAGGAPIMLPTGAYITPLAAPGATLQSLNPGLPSRPDFIAGQPATTAVSPDGRTLLVLTTGYNRNYGDTGTYIPSESYEYVFIFDALAEPPEQRQVIQVYNTFDGLAWTPTGDAFLVSGGMDDNVHIYTQQNGAWAESLPAIDLACGKPCHPRGQGLGLLVGPQAAGLAVNASGTQAVVANFENDTVSVLDLAGRSVIAEVELRPGRIDPNRRGIAGGEFPLWVGIRGNDKAYVSSTRDREVVVIDLAAPQVTNRIAVGGQPNRMILNRSQTRLFVANGNSDTVSVIDTANEQVIEQISTTAPSELFDNSSGWKGANPNSLALSTDEGILYVTNGGTNSVAVIRLGLGSAGNGSAENAEGQSRVIGLIPTGWYPHSVSASADARRLFIANGKSVPGPDEGACRDTLSPDPLALNPCHSRNQYVLQLEKGGLLSFPIPSGRTLAELTRQVGVNNHFVGQRDPYGEQLMAFLRNHIHHVIYIIKENRTYDQVLGDLQFGNGDCDLTIFPEAISPNHHALARQFVTLDRFFDSGEVSGVGWNWTTAARTTDIIEKTQFINYAGRGVTYDWEGTNRNINVGLETVAERQKIQPYTPDDPDLLPGAIDDAAPDAPDKSQADYLWDAAIRRYGPSAVRNYGCYGDLGLYSRPETDPFWPQIVPNPYELQIQQFFPTKASLMDKTDLFFRGYDQKNADYYNFKEWEREFDMYADKGGDLPPLELVRFPHDHFGAFTPRQMGGAFYRVNTPEKQMADNDYAIGLLIEKVAHSRYANDTLIFIIEDDAQDGPDHVDAHRSIGYIVGPYVRQGTVVSRPYTTINMIRTIEEVLDLEPLGLTDGLAEPMTDVFEMVQRPWSYDAIYPAPLFDTDLPHPPDLVLNGRFDPTFMPLHDAAYWDQVTAGQNFAREDALDAASFNQSLWRGVKGENVPYPTVRDGRDLSNNRVQLH